MLSVCKRQCQASPADRLEVVSVFPPFCFTLSRQSRGIKSSPERRKPNQLRPLNEKAQAGRKTPVEKIACTAPPWILQPDNRTGSQPAKKYSKKTIRNWFPFLATARGQHRSFFAQLISPNGSINLAAQRAKRLSLPNKIQCVVRNSQRTLRGRLAACRPPPSRH